MANSPSDDVGMSDNDLRIVLLAATAWLHERDLGTHAADLMDKEIDRDELARAIDRLSDG